MERIEIQQLVVELEEILNQESILEQNKLELAFKQGEILEKLKASLPHGHFIPFLEKNKIHIYPRKAQRMMKLKANEELIRSKATNLSEMSVDKALKIITKEEKSKEVKKVEKQIINLHELKIKCGFNKVSQQYEILLCFESDELMMAQQQNNISFITDAIKSRLKEFSETPCLMDLSTISIN